VTYIIVLLASGIEYLFSVFPTKASIELFFLFFSKSVVSLHLPISRVVLCNYVLDWLISGFNCLFSFP
jgi:hypothetical protein